VAARAAFAGAPNQRHRHGSVNGYIGQPEGSMDMSRTSNRRTDSPAATPAVAPADTDNAAAGPAPAPPGLGARLPLPHERDESVGTSTTSPDATIVQARHDIEAGKVDTDMRATPGLDADNRATLVPGPGGRTPSATSRDAQNPRARPNQAIPKVPLPHARPGTPA
jgi:hypothetical protein